LLPATPSAALVNAQPRKIACLEPTGMGRKGRQASGRTHCREIPIVQSAALRLPNRRVHQAAGNWTSCAVNGSAPSTPIRRGGSSR